ncbi:hypothetical protein TWF970_000722 [Orbilia oligospora]|uniref:Uncharacterized protein n=1 Tax=Orbilia oligospora TaxID=2813651 RepID=A0A7C8RP24_ORBOL|nr:hypothetical protein TWF970_000722 [Orbilia oligospora]
MSEMFQRIGRICPTMKEIGEIFPDDEKLKDSIRVLYAISIEFCIKALCFLRKPGMKQFAKSTWKPFKFEFQDIENELADRREIINDQIRVASEKAAAFARQKALIYQTEGYLHREYEVTQWDRSQEWRIEQDGSYSSSPRNLKVGIIAAAAPYYGIKAFHLTYIVVDGVDELDVRDRKYILDQFNEMLKLPGSILKVFILSRPEIDLPRTSRKAIFASPQSALRPELDAYVRDSLQKFDNLTSFPPKFMSEIQTALINGADGMFLWVEFQLGEIENKDRMVDIRKVIQNLPRGLNETYARILRKIMEHRNPEKALKIFKWLSTSRRPLMLEELQEAIAIDTSDTCHAQIKNRKTLDSFFELRDCANLAVLNERDDTVQFAHSTVRDFLLKESTITEFPSLYLDLISAKAEICNACLTYLSLNDFESQIVIAHKRPPLPKESILENPASWVPTLLKSRSIPAMVAGFYLNWRRPNSSPKPAALFRQKIKQPPTQLELLRQSFTFLDYARQNWIHHCDDLFNVAKETKTWQIFRTLLGKTLPFDHLPWKHTKSHSDLVYFDAFSWALHNSNFSVLTLIFDEITATERQSYLDSTVGEAGEPPLHIAVGLWSEGIVALLLQNGADPNSCYGGITALVKASVSGQSENAAAEGGHLDVVERLLDAKADINITVGYNGRTALQAAAEGGHLDVVEKLLAAKADVNAAAGRGIYSRRTVLQAAAEGGHLDIVEKLLAVKADVNAAAGNGIYGRRTALQAAAGAILILLRYSGGGYFNIVKRLLAAKVNINVDADVEKGRTALQAPAEGGHLNVIERLLAANADVNADAGAEKGRTALQAAAGGGHLDVIERLLAANADVNAAASYRNGRTALQAAAGGGHLDVIERLLAANADVNAAAIANADVNAVAINNYGQIALQIAAGGGHLDVVERFLAAKVKVNVVVADNNGLTALQVAARGGHLDVVERLLAAKANVNASTRHQGLTALRVAAENGQLDVVEKLLAVNADLNAIGRDGRTALQAARGRGLFDVVKRLRAAGAKY